MFVRLRRASLFLVGFTIPIQGLAIGGGFTLVATPFKFMVALLLVVAGVEVAFRAGGRPYDAKTFWVIGFVMSFAVSSAMSAMGGVPFEVILGPGSTLAALSLYYFLLTYAVRDRQDLRTVVWGIVLGGALTLGPAVQLVRQGAASTEADRFAGLAGQSNVLGADMAMCFALAVCLFFISRSSLAKLVAVGSAGLALVGVALSLSRSAFVSLGVMGIFWLVRSGRRDSMQYVIPAMVLAAIALVAAPTSVRERANTMFDATQRREDRSIQTRVYTDWVAVKAFASNPLLGVGAERFRLWGAQNRQGKLHTVHNAYLYIAAEQGLLGLVPFLAMLMLSWRDYSRAWRESRRHRLIRDEGLMELGQVALYLQIALLSALVAGLFHQQHRSKGLWTLMALSPLVLALVQFRLAEIRGSRAHEEPEAAPLFPELGDGHLAGSPMR